MTASLARQRRANAWFCGLLAAGAGGCSVVALSPLHAGLDERADSADCFAWIAPPVIDLAIAGYLGLVGLFGASMGEAFESEARKVFIASGVFVASTSYGVYATARCAEHNDDLASAPPPPPPELGATAAGRTLDRASARFAVCGVAVAPVRIALVVDEGGRVRRAHVDTRVAPAVARCVAAVAATVVFPPSTTGISFSYELRW